MGRSTFAHLLTERHLWCRRACVCAAKSLKRLPCPSPRLQYYTDTLDATIAQLKSEGR